MSRTYHIFFYFCISIQISIEILDTVDNRLDHLKGLLNRNTCSIHDFLESRIKCSSAPHIYFQCAAEIFVDIIFYLIN